LISNKCSNTCYNNYPRRCSIRLCPSTSRTRFRIVSYSQIYTHLYDLNYLIREVNNIMILSSRHEHANPRTVVPSHLASSGQGVLRRFASVRLRPVQMGVWEAPAEPDRVALREIRVLYIVVRNIITKNNKRHRCK